MDLNSAAVQVSATLNDREAQPRARHAAYVRAAMERFEYLGEFLGWDTNAAILDAKNNCAIGVVRRRRGRPLER